MKAREPAFCPGSHMDVLVYTFGDVLHAAQLTHRTGVAGAERRRRSHSCLAVAKPLARGGMIVFLHRVVFGMERDGNYESFSVLRSRFSVLNEERSTENGERRTIPLVLACRWLDDAAEVVIDFGFVVAGRHHDQVHAGGPHL